ncbi:hypothetical protein AB3R30_15390 [Leptolyngbyaceae cyanobacterium UHCC 1019]
MSRSPDHFALDRSTMTRLIAPTTHPCRRHSDPPKLWLYVLTGSFLFHLIAGATVQNFLANSVVQQTPTAIAVEFLEPIGEDSSTSLSQATLPPSKSFQPNQPVEEDTTQTMHSTPAISTPATSSQTAPTQPITEPLVTTPTRSAPIQSIPSKKTFPSPVDTSPFTSQPKRSTLTTAPIPDDSTLKKSVPATSNTRLPDVPIVPNPTEVKDDSNRAIASIPIPSSPTPAQFTAQFRAINLTSNSESSSIESTTSAQLLGEPTKLFSSDPSTCTLTPEALHSFGQPVKLQLPLDETGILNPQKLVTVKQSSGNIQYDELATCVTKLSRFIPAYTLEGDLKRPVSSNLDIQITLTQ